MRSESNKQKKDNQSRKESKKRTATNNDNADNDNANNADNADLEHSGLGFVELGLDPILVKNLAKHKVVAPTKVQEQVIPAVLNGKDIICQSETGSGKTIGFALPVIHMMKGHGGARVLVVTPTRELAKQVAGEFRKFSREKGLQTVTVYGGVSMGPQIDNLPDADIVVGTPGRILDLHRQGYMKLNQVKHLILDECDRMLDMGFIDDVDAIIAATPRVGRQVLLFSATVPDQVHAISQRYMGDVVTIKVRPYLVRDVLDQEYYVVEQHQKISLLVHLLKQSDMDGWKTLIFCRTKRMTDMVGRALQANGFEADTLHGDMSQAKRERVLEKFTEGKIPILAATDVAARGIHVDDIRFVINFDLPEELDTYIHRVGRTARQGHKGKAIALLAQPDFPHFDQVMHHYEGEIEKKVAKNVQPVSLVGRGGGRRGRERGRDGGRDGRRGGGRRDGGRSGGYRDGGRGGDRRGGGRSSGGGRSGGRGTFSTGSGDYASKQRGGKGRGIRKVHNDDWADLD